MIKNTALALVLCFTYSAHAKKFANQFIEFDLPPRWQCGLEGSEWVCQSTSKEQRHEAIIVLAAKHKGSQDSLDQYKSYLEQKKTFTLPGGKKITSEPKYVNYTKINDWAWVDSLHLASEIPNFYTRYLATVKSDIAVLLTYSVAKHKYKEYQPEFDALVDSLKVFRSSGGLNIAKKENSLFAKLPKNLGSRPDLQAPAQDNVKRQRPDRSGTADLLYYLIVIGMIAGALFAYKKFRSR